MTLVASHRVLGLLLASAPLLAGAPRAAHACGGCLAPPATVTTVNAHRMAISLSPGRTTLWDQIRYDGAPEDFVWILPVPSPKTTIELAPAAFFDELDGNTAPLVLPKASSGGPSVGCGGGGDTAADLGPDGDVIVYATGVVGPYETLTIGSEDPDALYGWLLDHDYQVTAETAKTMDGYIDKGNLFVILRLAPEQGTEAMQPVRVSYPGYMATFPLEMVKVGASGVLSLSLWVIAEQRYEAYNYGNATIDEKRLVYDWIDSSSNYDEVFRQALDKAGGRAWITEYAGPVPYLPSGGDEMARINEDIGYPFVTRLRTLTRVDYLDEDLVLTPARDPSPVDRFLIAGQEIARPASADSGCAAGRLGRLHPLGLIGLAGLLALGRRRRRAITLQSREF